MPFCIPPSVGKQQGVGLFIDEAVRQGFTAETVFAEKIAEYREGGNCKRCSSEVRHNWIPFSMQFQSHSTSTISLQQYNVIVFFQAFEVFKRWCLCLDGPPPLSVEYPLSLLARIGEYLLIPEVTVTVVIPIFR